MTYLTIEERERLAYAEGYTETAAVLARLDDAHRALGDEVAMQAQLDDANDKIDELNRSINVLGRQVIDAMDERERAKDQAKTYRAALMALESAVSPGVRDFIREVLA